VAQQENNVGEKTGKDLRVQKTRRAIRKTFAAMICEMDYDRVTIKELAARAQINRKTFYLHYLSLDDLLGEMQHELVEGFLKQTSSLHGLRDIAAYIKEFFLYTTDHEVLKQRILCSGSYRFLSDKVVEKVIHKNRNHKAGPGFDKYTENIIIAFLTSSVLEIYRQWVEDNRKIPIEKMIETTTQLICDGISAGHRRLLFSPH
jgi:AcrR family transcriptional regulator